MTNAPTNFSNEIEKLLIFDVDNNLPFVYLLA